MEPTTDNRLELRIDDLPSRGRSELHLLVDGRDLVAAVLPGPPTGGPDPRLLLGPYSPLLPGRAPREVRLHAAGCGHEECCGALYVTVREEAGAVHWDGWRNPLGADPGLPAYRFDAEQYAAEVERAGAGVEDWPARGVGRLLKDELVRRPELLAAWECELDGVWTVPSQPDRIELRFWHPAEPAPRGDEPYLQFTAELPVPEGEPQAAAAELVARLATTDPRTRARVCGGRADYAEALGYPWPEDM
ncbi:hypothetical protein Kpho02_54070 [Kitasatospora phosalacinea]|uniref:Uncharacterized protein n=1 Tax=Kitasatospora phosalacinea TaxID=2065 RepID=A0A9W6QDP7_9ACTN|nr:hypothetical protein [Kitasatospora phosalacinea]GLW73108.1 hypothetical protein Kpho02_54070 [Kitasatospora phosalacinea]